MEGIVQPLFWRHLLVCQHQVSADEDLEYIQSCEITQCILHIRQC